MFLFQKMPFEASKQILMDVVQCQRAGQFCHCSSLLFWSRLQGYEHSGLFWCYGL